MGRRRRSSTGEQSGKSVEPDSRAVTRSRSRAAGSDTSPQLVMASTQEASGSPSTASKRQLLSFVPNSPIRKPYLVEYDSNGQQLSEPSIWPDPDLSEAYEKANQRYIEKIGQLLKLPTLDDDTCFEPIPIQESAADTILKASKFIFGLSAYIDGVLLRQSSGILMEWNDNKGTILTTVYHFCSKSPNVDVWLGGQEYARDAEVRVQLLHMDDTEVTGELIYLDEQYGFALISVPMDPPEMLPRFCNELVFSEDIFLLGRDKWDLQIGNGKVMNKGAGSYQRHHYMYFDADISLCGFGGAVINLEGDVIGLIASSTEFIPSSTILKCLHLWRTFKCQEDRIAENHGVRIGDIIQAVNGECIATAIQLENMLLDTCKGYLEKGIGCDSDEDVVLVLDVFNTTKRLPGRIELTAKLSRGVEIIERGKYEVSMKNYSTLI